MAKELLLLVKEADEGGFVAGALGYYIFTEADSWEELESAARGAVQCRLDEGERPELIRLHAVHEDVVPA
jgi:hypothetical protein